MYGVVTRNAEEVQWPEFDIGFYEVKDVTGRQTQPLDFGVNMLSCFGDNAAAAGEPDLVPVDDQGRPATRDRKYFDWSYVCPTHPKYREGLLELISNCAEVNENLRLDDVGFPRPEFCHCDRCEQQYEASEYDDWQTWRSSVITEFVTDAAARIPGRTYLTLFPDPYPGHLADHEGIDVAALVDHVDEFVVPLYDMAYSTTYWLQTIASGFESLLDSPFSIELYAVDVDLDNLVKAAEVADHFAKDVFFGYDAANARAAVRRLTASEGETYTPDDLDPEAKEVLADMDLGEEAAGDDDGHDH